MPNEKKSEKKKSKKGSENQGAVLEEKLAALEMELMETEKRLLGLFELTNDAIFLIGLDGCYIDVNQQAADLLGYNKQDMIGKSMLDIVTDNEKEESKKRFEEILSGNILPLYVRTFKRKDGTIIPVEINASIVHDLNGKPEYIQSVVRDIRERIKANKFIRRERQIFRQIAEATITSKDVKEFAEKVFPTLLSLLEFDVVSFRLYDSLTKKLIPIAYFREDGDYENNQIFPQSVDSQDFIHSKVARLKRSLVHPRYDDRKELEPFLETIERLGITTLITSPLQGADGKLVGVVQLVSYEKSEVLDEDLKFFETITSMITFAIERLKTAEALAESENKYRSFVQNFQGIAYRRTLIGEPVFYHGEVEKISGYKAEELLQKNPAWETLVLKEDQGVINRFKRIVKNKFDKSIHLEYRITRKDGVIVTIQEIANIIRNEDNEAQFVQGVIYDVTNRKRTEDMQRLQRNLSVRLSSVNNLKDALTYVLEAACSIDVIDCGSVFLMNKLTGMLNHIAHHGLPYEYVERLSIFSPESPFTNMILSGQAVYGHYYEVVPESADDILKSEGLRGIGNVPIYSEGKIVAALVLASRTTDIIPLNARNALETIAGQIGGAIARIRAEEALRESDQRYRSFVQNFQGIAYQIKPDGSIIFLHGLIERLTGYTEKDFFSGKITLKDSIHPYDIEMAENNFKNAIKNKEISGNREYRLITKDGKVRWVSDFWVNIFNSDDEVIAMQGSVYDTTDRRQAESELQRLYENLERRVAERTEQLTDANKELTAFSYSVSHDLRTPIRHIEGFAKLLMQRIKNEDGVDQKVIDYTSRIINSTEEMNKLIDGLLTFSRMSRVEMVQLRIDLEELINEVIAEFQPEIDSRDVRFDVNRLPIVIGDPSLLRIVFVNLLSNAIKFTKTKKTAVIEIGTLPSKDEDKATIFVRDNGVGFNMKYYEQLFAVFQRLHKMEDFKGTGIGLATVRRVVRRQGGRIWAEGEVGKGSTFFVAIPKALDINNGPTEPTEESK